MASFFFFFYQNRMGCIGPGSMHGIWEFGALPAVSLPETAPADASVTIVHSNPGRVSTCPYTWLVNRQSQS
jgi:hypothetical protein